MDAPSSIWSSILEFVLQERVDSEWAKGVIATIPPSFLSIAVNVDPSVKKAILLCSLEDDLGRGSITLGTLKTLELIEEIDRPDNIDYLMCLAYRAVAAHCTAQSVREDKEGASGDEKYKDVVDRLWRARVGDFMQSGANIGLLSINLCEWYESVVTTTADPKSTRDRVMRRISLEKTEEMAKDLLGQYVREARRGMGPSIIQCEYEKACKAEVNGLGIRRATDAAVLGACKDRPDAVSLSSISSTRNLNQTANVEDTQKPVHAPTNDPSAPELEGHGRNIIAPVPQKDGGRTSDYGVHSSSARRARMKDGAHESHRGGFDRQEEWHDGLDETVTPEVRPKRKKVTLVDLPQHKKNARRTPRKWSAEEELALIKAVKRFGKGEWKTILDAYRPAFDGRTEVDLKDKWRNMIKPNKQHQD